ncbi:hypothetical protein C8A03DRAFT_12390 [Achaetomium macrosporum]|uniref:LysM domain-containing protein n=1 Tax=Achaetomium macrosporum TaxID=79813 RepID=A0AAN7CGP8_9PEZI|nr:hypothetical protein C8A03DRAFT_12390 [Achaetomium macrosporum]
MVSARVVSRRSVDCTFSTTADGGATCESFAASWGLSVDDLKGLNPGITWPGLDTSKTYFVIGAVTDHPPTSTSTSKFTQAPSTTLKTSTATSPPAPSNSPTMPGLAENCDRFYKVASGDQCDTVTQKDGISTAQFMSWPIYTAAGITLDQFRSWNTQIDEGCTNLWLGYYVCIGV